MQFTVFDRGVDSGAEIVGSCLAAEQAEFLNPLFCTVNLVHLLSGEPDLLSGCPARQRLEVLVAQSPMVVMWRVE